MILYTLKKADINGERQAAFISDIYEQCPDLAPEVQTLSIREFEEMCTHITRNGLVFDMSACRGYTDATVSDIFSLYNNCKDDIYKETDIEDDEDDIACREKYKFSLIQARAPDFFSGHEVTDEYKKLRGIEYNIPALILGSFNSLSTDFGPIPVNGTIDYGINENNKFIIVTDGLVEEFMCFEFFDTMCTKYKEFIEVPNSL